MWDKIKSLINSKETFNMIFPYIKETIEDDTAGAKELYDAINSPVQDPLFQKIVNQYVFFIDEPVIKSIRKKVNISMDQLTYIIVAITLKENLNILNKYLQPIFESNSSNKSLINECYYELFHNKKHEIKLALDKEKYFINNKKDIEEFFRKFLQTTRFNTLANVSSDTSVILLQKIFEKYKNLFVEYVNKKLQSSFSDENNNAYHHNCLIKLKQYINDNLRTILRQMQFEKDKNSNVYSASWFDEDGTLDNNFEIKALNNWLRENKMLLVEKLNLKPNEKEYFIKKYDLIKNHFIHHELKNEDFIFKINSFITLKNHSMKRLRAKDLLNLQDDDKIGIKNNTFIDYDITDDHVRTNPIIIIYDLNTNKDVLMIGPKGMSHRGYIENKLNEDCIEKDINPDPYKMSYGYLLINIAFIDEVMDNVNVGYTFDEVVRIMKNDPRIKKVYTTPGHPCPGGGPITRLAKKK